MTLDEDLLRYTERSTQLLNNSPQMDEENTKRKLIDVLEEPPAR